MSQASDYLENALIKEILNGINFAAPSSVYIALSTANPLDDASGLAEPSGNGYARVQVTAGFTVTGGAAVNAASIEFPAATGSWGTITHFAIFDASSGGNMLVYGALTSSIAVAAGQVFRFSAGNLAAEVQ